MSHEWVTCFFGAGGGGGCTLWSLSNWIVGLDWIGLDWTTSTTPPDDVKIGLYEVLCLYLSLLESACVRRTKITFHCLVYMHVYHWFLFDGL